MIWILVAVLGGTVVYAGIQTYIRKVIVEKNQTGSFATHPGRVKPARLRLRDLTPGLYPQSLSFAEHKEAFRVRLFIGRQLWHGASNPALVLQENPVIIAAYAADCDAVILLRFVPESVEALKARGFGLSPGTRLLSINTYFPPGTEHKSNDVVLGPKHSNMWRTFRPYIAEFMSNDIDTIEQRKREIPAELWDRTRQLGMEKLKGADLDRVRWGNPMYAEVAKSYLVAMDWCEQYDMPY